MILDTLVAPFPYFGGKRHVADMVWDLLGDVDAYVEPFAGSAAVLLGRPNPLPKREILNDLDGWITNLWRAVREAPDDVIRNARGPITELDLHARAAWLKERNTPELVSWLEGDPEHFDAKAAGWWLYATIGSIGGGTRPGPWVQRDGLLQKVVGGQDGITRSIPHISRGRAGLKHLDETIPSLQERMKNVIITCGDWKRPLSKSLRYYSSVGVFLDPPYESRSRTVDGLSLYASDGHDVSREVREWCRTAPSGWRVVLCGYDNEHDELLDANWRKVDPPKAVSSGYNVSDLNSRRDRLWASPSCMAERTSQQLDFDALSADERKLS